MSGLLFAFPFKDNEYRVIDGDTVAVILDRGWKSWKGTSLRLIGLNAPEVRTRHVLHKKTGLAVGRLVIKWFEDRAGKHFYGTSDSKPKYAGRTVGRIWADDVSDCLNDYLLQMKVVKPYTGKAKKPVFTDEELNTIIAICERVLGPEPIHPTLETG